MATSDAPLSVPDVTLAVARGVQPATGQVVDNADGTITITGAGFGSTAPIFVCNIDPNASADGTQLLHTEVQLGPGTTIETASLNVISQPSLPGGMALDIGTNSTDLASTAYANFKIYHPVEPRVFESRTSYYPAANAERAADYRDGVLADPHPGGSGTNLQWQIKPVWNLIDNNDAGSNFFLVSNERTVGTNPTVFAKDPQVSSNSSNINKFLGSFGFSNVQERSYGSAKLPLDEPYTTEFGWDIGDLSASLTQGSLFGQIYSTIFGVQSEGTLTDIQLAEDVPDFTRYNMFKYPGFVRGFCRPLETSRHETQIFRQVGPAAYARIAICDNPDYFISKRRILLQPVDGVWSDTLVGAHLPVWAQSLSDFTGDYVCVVDENNVQVGTGEII